MALWGRLNQANNAPKWITDLSDGDTGVEEFGTKIIYVDGSEGYPVPPGWARKYAKGSRTIWESLAAASFTGGSSWPNIVNLAGLSRWKTAFASQASTPATIWCVGDSITWGVGWDGTGNATAEADARLYSFPAKLRTYFSDRGLNTGGFIAAASVATDSLLVAANTTVTTSVGLTSFCRSINSTGPGTLTFSLPQCTAIDIIYWESNGTNSNPTTGSFNYNIDGAGAVAVNYAATVAAYKVVTVSGLSNTAHSVVLTGTTSGSAFIAGIRYRTASGIVVGRFGRPGWTSNDILGKGGTNNVSAAGQVRVLDAFSMGSPALVIIELGANDCSKQLTQSTTVSVYKANLQAIVDKVAAAGGCSLILSAPNPPYAEPVGGESYAAYWQAADEVAMGSAYAASVKVNGLAGWPSAATAIASGLQNTASIHPTISGYANIATNLGLLLD